MPGEISFRPTMDDYVAANRAYFRRAIATRRFVGVLAAGEGVVAAVGVTMTWGERDPHLRLVVVGGMCLGFLAWMLAMLVAGYAIQPRAARKLFRQHRALDRDFTVSWDEAGTRFAAATGHGVTAWRDYHGWYDGRDVVLLMLNDRLFQFIPPRALTVDQLADLRALAPRAGEAVPTAAAA